MTMEVPRMVIVKRAILAALLDSSLRFTHCARLVCELGSWML